MSWFSEHQVDPNKKLTYWDRFKTAANESLFQSKHSDAEYLKNYTNKPLGNASLYGQTIRDEFRLTLKELMSKDRKNLTGISGALFKVIPNWMLNPVAKFLDNNPAIGKPIRLLTKPISYVMNQVRWGFGGLMLGFDKLLTKIPFKSRNLGEMVGWAKGSLFMSGLFALPSIVSSLVKGEYGDAAKEGLKAVIMGFVSIGTGMLFPALLGIRMMGVVGGMLLAVPGSMLLDDPIRKALDWFLPTNSSREAAAKEAQETMQRQQAAMQNQMGGYPAQPQYAYQQSAQTTWQQSQQPYTPPMQAWQQPSYSQPMNNYFQQPQPAYASHVMFNGPGGVNGWVNASINQAMGRA